MGYALSCGDVMPGCAATFEADSEDDLLGQAAAHASADHGVSEIPPEVLERVKGAVRQT